MSFNLGIVTGSLSQAGGGLFHSVRIPAKALTVRGADVTVYGLRDDLFEAARPDWNGVRVECFDIRGPARLGFSPTMLRSVLTTSHDVLHTHGIWAFPSHVTDSWRRRHRKPTIISPRGMLDPWAVQRSAVKKGLLRLLYEDANLHGAFALHALNSNEAAAFRAFGLRNPVAIIPNAVDLPDVSKSHPTPPYAANDQRKVLLFLSRVHPKKGLFELVDAWRHLVAASPATASEWRLVIAGWDDGGHLEALAALIRAQAMERHVALVGPLYGAPKADALAHASAFVLPSYSEGLPMSVLEAWSWQLPVFMTAACNLPDGFASGAAIAIPNQPAAMADIMRSALNDASGLAVMGSAGRALVEQRYTWDRVVADMEQMYRWAIGGGPEPTFIDRSST